VETPRPSPHDTLNLFSERNRLHLYSYRAYGLGIQSDSFIPGFCADIPSAPCDVSLEIGPEPPCWFLKGKPLDSAICYNQPAIPETADPAYTLTVWGARRFFELAYSDGARFLIDADAKRVWGQCPPLTIEDIGVYLRGPIMGFVLRRRGVAALHASAVSISGQSVVMCGPSESGKSTTAAALALRGIPVHCDDITAVGETAAGFFVESGYPRICLWPDAVEHLLGAPDILPRLTPTWGKCFLPLDGIRATFEARRQPLGVVYMFSPRVSESRAPRVAQLSSRQALLELVQNTYLNWLLDRERRAAEFDVLTRLVMEVPVRRIIPHSDPHRIGALCDLIRDDAERLTAAPARSKMLTSRP
jgi:hypothetical protein